MVLVKLIEFRNFLYRIKSKILYESLSPISVLRRSLWISAGVYDGVHEVFRSSYSCFSDFDLHGVDDRIISDRYIWENKTYNYQSDIVYKIDADVYLEPIESLGLIKNRIFVEETKSRAHKYLLPHPFNLIKLKFLNKVTRLESAVLFDGYASRNHYHFFDDALNPLMMMIESGVIDWNMPVVYNHKLDQYKWFNYYKNLPPFNGLNWRRQEPEEWIVCKSLYKGVTTKKWWGNLYRFVEKNIEKTPAKSIFIERKVRHARSFSNKSEIYKILEKNKFEIYVLDDMSYDEQINLFASARNVVAHHGAGLANLIYSDTKNIRLMELFSADLLQPHYYWLAQELGVKYYDALLGSKFDVSYNYWVDPVLFERKILKLLAQ